MQLSIPFTFLTQDAAVCNKSSPSRFHAVIHISHDMSFKKSSINRSSEVCAYSRRSSVAYICPVIYRSRPDFVLSSISSAGRRHLFSSVNTATVCATRRSDAIAKTRSLAVARISRPYPFHYIRRPASDFRSRKQRNFPEWLQSHTCTLRWQCYIERYNQR